MGVQTLAQKVMRREAAARSRNPAGLATLAHVRTDPAVLVALAGMAPDLWQAKLLQSDATRMPLLSSTAASRRHAPGSRRGNPAALRLSSARASPSTEPAAPSGP